MSNGTKQANTRVRRLHSQDGDLADIAARLNAADSEVSLKQFSEATLRTFLADDSRVYLVAHRDNQLAGALHGYSLLHPAGVTYFYVDELDTVAEFRRQGVATELMRAAFAVARELGAYELWLGTEHTNPGAKEFYATLAPDEIEEGPIYTWKLKDPHGQA